MVPFLLRMRLYNFRLNLAKLTQASTKWCPFNTRKATPLAFELCRVLSKLYGLD